MAALATTVTVLGAVALFEPVNGYQVRRELLSWGLDQWAQIKPGSIYSMLTTLTRDGSVDRHDVEDDGRPVAVYTTTEAGRSRLGDLLCTALTVVDPLSPLPFHVGLMLAGLLPREDAVRCLTTRRQNLRSATEDFEATLRALTDGEPAPPHVAGVVALGRELVRTEADWLDHRLQQIEAGEFTFAGEPSSWQPPPEDPGRQMGAERARYRRLLQRRRA